MDRPLLVYDGGNELLRVVADLVDEHTEFKPVEWDSEPVQDFLEAQFEETPFALIVVEGHRAHVGDAAVEYLLDEQGVPPEVSDLCKRAYPPAAGPVGRLLHGREPDDLHGSFPVDETARAHLGRIDQSHDIPVTQE